MKITKPQLVQIIREEIEAITETLGQVSGMGGVAGGLAALGRTSHQSPENEEESITQQDAMTFFMDLGLDDKVSAVLVKNIATPDLKIVMDAVPKIDTAAEDEAMDLEEDV